MILKPRVEFRDATASSTVGQRAQAASQQRKSSLLEDGPDTRAARCEFLLRLAPSPLAGGTLPHHIARGYRGINPVARINASARAELCASILKRSLEDVNARLLADFAAHGGSEYALAGFPQVVRMRISGHKTDSMERRFNCSQRGC